ncbi:unnamed protein product [Fraxinus pennsylvanica]|uniref:Origin recognition complex subunit 5 C-terminal domain-containing protein n=1 Tax=Fraxinus pennsylvanica TaxID=56036 RepID=A0AAD1Z092_9LAMI|nr:unnamed protein product [Fraxinus pennsylvanica]
MVPLFVYGDASSGKISTILEIFKHMKCPFIYSNCITCYNPRILFESILNQLLLLRKNENDGYSSAKRCEKPSDFVNLLHDAMRTFIDRLKGFLLNSVVLRPFCLITRSVDDVTTAISLLFKKYCEPLDDSGITPNEDIKRKLLDASPFDSIGGFGNRKRKRKSSEKSMEKKESKDQESLMKVPGTFPLERLLALFQCISFVAEYSPDDEILQIDVLGTDGWDSGMMADVLLQLSSLCSANFITK